MNSLHREKNNSSNNSEAREFEWFIRCHDNDQNPTNMFPKIMIKIQFMLHLKYDLNQAHY